MSKGFTSRSAKQRSQFAAAVASVAGRQAVQHVSAGTSEGAPPRAEQQQLPPVRILHSQTRQARQTN